MKRIISLLLIFSIIFVQSFLYPSFASPVSPSLGKSIVEAEQNALGNLLDTASEEKFSRVQSIFANPKTQLREHLWEGNTLHAVYSTENPNIFLTISGEIIQIVEKIDDETFLVDDELITVKVSTESEKHVNSSENLISPLAGWIKVPNPGVSWTYDQYVVENVQLSKAIKSFTVATLGTILGLAVPSAYGLIVALVSIAYGAIEMALAITDENPSIVRIRRHIYKDTATNGFLYRRTVDYGDIRYKGSYRAVSSTPEYHYFSKSIGGP